jgi:hypothetical protein
MSDEQTTISGWFGGRLPSDWFTGPVAVVVDREEITVTGPVAEPEAAADADEVAVQQARAGRIARFREDTRAARMAIADEAEHRFGRKVAWAASCGDVQESFTRLAVPMMTRLRQPERLVLDTLVAGGVARSRSEALGWCVRLVGQHTDDWLQQLRDALRSVDEVRAQGPTA